MKGSGYVFTAPVLISAFILTLLAFAIAGTNASLTLQPPHSRVQLARKATIYCLPLVIMDVARAETLASPGAMPNGFLNRPILATPASRTVVRPNVNTIYSTAWLDLSAEPVVMSVPPSKGRYFMIQCMDAWTNVIADPGIRTLGNKGARYAIVGPDWHGPVPDSVTEIRAPTRMVWVLARVYVRDQADLPAARAFQRQLDVRPLSRLHDPSFLAAYPRPGERNTRRPAMLQILQHVGPQAFFERFMKLTVANPPAPQDAQFIKDVLEPIGISPGKPKPWGEIDPLDRQALAREFEQVLDAFKSGVSLDGRRRTCNGWSGLPGKDDAPAGSYGTHYAVRTKVAVFDLAENLRADAVYLKASVDANGNRLEGNKQYRLRFEAGKTPPARGFWSVTLYDNEGYLVANPLGRCAIRSGDPLHYEPDGSLVLYLQPNDPLLKHRANWLPRRAGTRSKLSLRMYWPEEEVLQGRWTPPPVMPVNETAPHESRPALWRTRFPFRIERNRVRRCFAKCAPRVFFAVLLKYSSGQMLPHKIGQ